MLINTVLILILHTAGVSVYVYTVGECISRAGDMVFLKNVGLADEENF